MRPKPIATVRRPRPASIAGTGITVDKNGTAEPKKQTKPPLPKTRQSAIRKSQEKLENTVIKKAERIEKKKKTVASPITETNQHLPVMHSPIETKTLETSLENVENNASDKQIDTNIVNQIIPNEETKEIE